MKTTLLALASAMIFVVGSIATPGFASPGEKHAEEKGGHHELGGDNHAGGHMGRMNDFQKKLKHELGDKYNQPVPAATKEQLAIGKKVYIDTCAACHGASGKGDGPAAAALDPKPANFTDPEHSVFYSDQARIQIIKKGVSGTAMTGWESALSEKEIKSVHAYVRSLRGPASKEKHGQGGHGH
ncbi:MAG: cytochrome c [Acidiferrobacterales bacterium]